MFKKRRAKFQAEILAKISHQTGIKNGRNIQFSISQIIFFVYHREKFDYDRYGVEILEENGFKVEFWDFTPFLYSAYSNKHSHSDLNNLNIKIFQKRSDALQAISKATNNAIIVCLIPYNIDTYPIFKMLSIRNAKYCIINMNALPLPIIRHRLFHINTNLKNYSLKKTLSSFLIKIPHKVLGLKPAGLLLAGGEKSISKRFPMGPKTQVLWLHAMDYDIFLKVKNKKTFSHISYAVFLDDFLPFHSDFSVLGIDAPYSKNPDEYYSVLCNFFKILEKKFCIKIIIAAHPRSSYSRYPDFFEGRSIIKGKTAELVSQSKFVIAYASTSINFAILFNKPLLLYTTDKLREFEKKNNYAFDYSKIAKEPINLNNINHIDLEKELNIDFQAYGSCRNDFIKKNGTQESISWQIFSDYIKNNMIS
jgi:hypothetical protein